MIVSSLYLNRPKKEDLVKQFDEFTQDKPELMNIDCMCVTYYATSYLTDYTSYVELAKPAVVFNENPKIPPVIIKPEVYDTVKKINSYKTGLIVFEEKKASQIFEILDTLMEYVEWPVYESIYELYWCNKDGKMILVCVMGEPEG